MVGGTLSGDVDGKSGSGALAKLVFEYFVEEYEAPHVTLSEKVSTRTCLIQKVQSST
ncbi:MAG: hypothetical protein QMD23_00055 [Candidatus Bathyarchaeia archaeon]|nr:hypothetical protein [Candidatus Bathyarchaeia archaeon]